MGELLVSKKGLGYLINFGSQTFNLNLVITSIVILGILSYIFYLIIDRISKKYTNKNWLIFLNQFFYYVLFFINWPNKTNFVFK